MNKKKWIIVLVICLVGFSVLAIQKLMTEGVLRVGFPKEDLIKLENGTYIVKDIDISPGKYAIYAVEGDGVVRIGTEEHSLNSSLFLEAKARTGSVPKSVLYSVVYEESPKINLENSTVITVEGDPVFKISFVGR